MENANTLFKFSNWNFNGFYNSTLMTEQTITRTDIVRYHMIVQIREQGVGCLWWNSTWLYPIVPLRSGSDHELGRRGQKHNLKYCARIADSDPNARFLLSNVKGKPRCLQHNLTEVANYPDVTWNPNIWLVAGKFSRTFNQKNISVCACHSNLKFRMLLRSY